MAQPRTILAGPAWRPSPKAKLLWAVQTAGEWLILLVAVIVWVVIDSGNRGWQLLAVCVVLVAGVIGVAVVPWWRYTVHRWEITSEAVYTRVGWLSQESRVAPISRVQTVDIERGPLERLLGLATVTVTTASSAGAVTITGLDLPVAEKTVAELTEIAARHRGDAT